MAKPGKKKRAYLNDFKKNEEGKYDYTGDIYVLEGNGENDQADGLRGELLRLWGLCVILIGCSIAAGCVTAPGMDNSFYVILPYAGELIASISVCWAMCRFSAGGSRLKAYIYEASVAALPVRTLLACFCIVMSVVGEIIFLCFHGTDGKMVGFVVFVLLNMVEFAASLLIRRRIQAMRWMKMVI